MSRHSGTRDNSRPFSLMMCFVLLTTFFIVAALVQSAGIPHTHHWRAWQLKGTFPRGCCSWHSATPACLAAIRCPVSRGRHHWGHLHHCLKRLWSELHRRWGKTRCQHLRQEPLRGWCRNHWRPAWSSACVDGHTRMQEGGHIFSLAENDKIWYSCQTELLLLT